MIQEESPTQQTCLERENPLGYAPIKKLLIQFTMPCVFTMLITSVYNIADQIFIGQGVGPIGNAATTVCFPLMILMTAVATMVGNGGGAYAAIKLGEHKIEEAQRTLGNAVLLLAAGGLLFAVFGILLLTPLLTLFGATPANLGYSIEYGFVILLGAPFQFLGIGLANMARVDGSPKLAMYSILAGAVLNVILDPLYIFVFHWGVAGAAVATITSQIISALILLYYFTARGKMRLSRESMQFRPLICKTSITLGTSNFITQCTHTLRQIILNHVLVHYGNLTEVGGDIALSAMGIVLKVDMILVGICLGIAVGAQPIMGFNKGANQMARVKETYFYATKTASIVAVAGWAAFMLVPGPILSLFGTQNLMFTSFAVKCLRIYLAGVFCIGLQLTTTAYFQATAQPMKASVLSMVRQLLLLSPLIILFPMIWGLNGVLYAGPVADFGATILVLFLMIPEIKKLNRAL